MFGRKRRGKDLDGWLEELDRNESRFDDAWAAMLADRPPAAASGVDLNGVLAGDPAFDGHAFLAIARESYFGMREAWEKRDARMARGLCTRPIMTELEVAISNDLAAGRKHLLPGIEINSAVITNASASDSKLTVIVRMHLIGKEHYVDETTFALVAGDDEYHDWDEEWTFEKVPGIDDPVEDREHALLREAEGGWDYAHRGWNVAGIERIGAPSLA
jgi:predicted lipid-binding transport protein (Tim44 family)